MDSEPLAKRRCLNYDGTIARKPDRSKKGFAQVHHNSIPSEDASAVKAGILYDTSARFGCETGTEKTFGHRLSQVQQPDHVPRNKSLSGLHQASYPQDEAAHNSLRPIAGAVMEDDVSGEQYANAGHRDIEGDGEVCFGMVCHLSRAEPPTPLNIYTNNQCTVHDTEYLCP